MTSRIAIAIEATDSLFQVPFPYISQRHVTVAFNRLIKTAGIDYYWKDGSNIEFFRAPGKGILEVIRNTPIEEALVTFHNGSQLTQEELNTAVTQCLYGTQELKDYYEALINGSLDALVLQSGAATAGPVIDKVIQEILASEQLKELQARITDIDTTAAQILATRIAMNNLTEVVAAFAELDGVEIGTFIKNLKQEVVDGDKAIAETLALIGAKSGDGKAWVLDKNRVEVTPGVSLAATLQALQTSIGDVAASVGEERTSRTEADSATATRVTNVEASIRDLTSPTGGVMALITSAETASVTRDTALGKRVDGVLTQVGDNKALFDSTVSVLTGKDTANASAITTLQTRVGNNEASIQTVANVANGVAANYMVKTDVNGYVAGYGLWNGGTTSQFYVLADKFAVIAPGYPGVVPFAVDANGVYMNNAYIRNLTVDKITGGAIRSEWALNSSSGRIVLDTGAFMKVLGVAFGMYSDLIEWFGPKMPISQCSKTNGITWVGMDGSAYFGGNLRAGVLYNAGQTTAISGSAYVDVGPFWTNGKSKTVVVSYQVENAQQSNPYSSNQFQWNGVNPAATVVLYRSVNGGAFVECARWSWTGGVSTNNEFDGPDNAWSSCSGSGTFTDNTGASNITYRAQIVSRTDASFSHPNGIQVSNWTQRVGIISTEQ